MTTCRDCDARWTGDRTAHCPRCHETFTADSHYDQHLNLDRGPGIYRVVGCIPPAEVVDRHGNRRLYPKVKPDGQTFWQGEPMPDALRARRAEAQRPTSSRGAEDGLPQPNGIANAKNADPEGHNR